MPSPLKKLTTQQRETIKELEKQKIYISHKDKEKKELLTRVLANIYDPTNHVPLYTAQAILGGQDKNILTALCKILEFHSEHNIPQLNLMALIHNPRMIFDREKEIDVFNLHYNLDNMEFPECVSEDDEKEDEVLYSPRNIVLGGNSIQANIASDNNNAKPKVANNTSSMKKTYSLNDIQEDYDIQTDEESEDDYLQDFSSKDLSHNASISPAREKFIMMPGDAVDNLHRTEHGFEDNPYSDNDQEALSPIL